MGNLLTGLGLIAMAAGAWFLWQSRLATEQEQGTLLELCRLLGDLIARMESSSATLPPLPQEPVARLAVVPKPPEHPLADRVCRLADEGKDAEEISRMVGKERGVVDLILRLRSYRS